MVENPWFDAAGYAYSEKEMKAFKEPDGRPKTWFKYKHAKRLAK